MTLPNNWVQRVYVLVEAGTTDKRGNANVIGLLDYAEIPNAFHYRDERELAAALRRLADRVEQGRGFVGPVEFRHKETLNLLRNEP